MNKACLEMPPGKGRKEEAQRHDLYQVDNLKIIYRALLPENVNE